MADGEPLDTSRTEIELCELAIREASRLGADYGEARFERIRRHQVDLGLEQSASERETLTFGLAVRVLVNGAWGVSQLSDPTEHDVSVAVRRAVSAAKTVSLLQDEPVTLQHLQPYRGTYRTEVLQDPFVVPGAEKMARLHDLDQALRSRTRHLQRTRIRFEAIRRTDVLISTLGSEVYQEFVHTGLSLEAVVSNRGVTQRRSYPGGGHLALAQGGFELLDREDWHASARRVADEAGELLKAKACPSMKSGSVILTEHLVAEELIGWAAVALAGANATRLDATTLPSGLCVTADGTVACGTGTYGCDAEGMPPFSGPMASGGRALHAFSGRDSRLGRGESFPPGSMRAAHIGMVPRPFPSNLRLGLDSTTAGSESVLAGVSKGVLLDGGCVELGGAGSEWVQCEVGWEIHNGELGRMLKNPSYLRPKGGLLERLVSVGTPALQLGRCVVTDGSGYGVPVGVEVPRALFQGVQVRPW
jgi:TldD protein